MPPSVTPILGEVCQLSKGLCRRRLGFGLHKLAIFLPKRAVWYTLISPHKFGYTKTKTTIEYELNDIINTVSVKINVCMIIMYLTEAVM